MVDDPASDVRTVPEPGWIRLVDRISRVLAGISAGVVAVLAVHVFVDVTARWLANRPLPGTLEYVTFWWMPAVVFLALAGGQLRAEHMKVTLLTDLMTARARRIAEVVILLVVAALIVVLTYYLLLGAIESTRIRQAALGVAVVPLWPAKWAAVVGLAAFLLQTAATLWRVVTGAPTVPHQVLDDVEPARLTLEPPR